VAPEEIVFLEAVALGALKTADEENRHADRNQNGENASIHCEPMRQVLHLLVTALAGALIAHIEFTCKIRCRVTVGRKYCTKGNVGWLSVKCAVDGKKIQLQIRE
jgi:hypothetical protein